LPPPEAFFRWSRYLCCVIIDPAFSSVVDRDPRLRGRYHASHKVIEEQFTALMVRWVYSATWDSKANAGLRKHMNGLAYSTTEGQPSSRVSTGRMKTS